MGRGIPPMTLAILLALVTAHLAYSVTPPLQQVLIDHAFALYPFRFTTPGPDSFPHWYDGLTPLIGHAFLHYDWTHLFMNGLGLLLASSIVERRVGAWRTAAIFVVSALSGAAAYILINPSSTTPAIGASGAVCGLFAAFFLSLGRNWRDALQRPEIRNGAIVFLVVNVGLAAVARMTGLFPIAWEAHLGGFIGGAAAYLALAPRGVRGGPWG